MIHVKKMQQWGKEVMFIFMRVFFFLPDTLKAQRSFLRLFLKNIIFLLNRFISQAIKQGALKYTVFLKKKLLSLSALKIFVPFFFKLVKQKRTKGDNIENQKNLMSKFFKLCGLVKQNRTYMENYLQMAFSLLIFFFSVH